MESQLAKSWRPGKTPFLEFRSLLQAQWLTHSLRVILWHWINHASKFWSLFITRNKWSLSITAFIAIPTLYSWKTDQIFSHHWRPPITLYQYCRWLPGALFFASNCHCANFTRVHSCSHAAQWPEDDQILTNWPVKGWNALVSVGFPHYCKFPHKSVFLSQVT